MAQIIKEIDVEVLSPNSFQAVVAKQNDCNSRFIKAAFVNKGEKIDITPVSKVLINARRSDGEAGSFEGVVNDDSTVTVPLHSWILEVDGMVDCDISTINELDEKLTSTKFQVFVEKASCGNEEIIEIPQHDILLDLIEQVESLSPANLDTALSMTSENAVQNKVITEAIFNKADISELDSKVDKDILDIALGGKMDKFMGEEGSYGGFDGVSPQIKAFVPDTAPTENSTRLITSGGVYAVIGDIETALDSIIALQNELIGGDAE